MNTLKSPAFWISFTIMFTTSQLIKYTFGIEFGFIFLLILMGIALLVK
jgi:hypothetical protein